LTIKFLEGPKNSEVYTFTTKDDTILVGRMVDCRVRFDDNSMSRYQCSIFHDERGWVLVDGMGDKKSTNGTWLFVEEDYEIFDKLVFKAGKTLFQVQIE
jgi:pSer/pThr/pTyr-binding forkhead associated (FHA) protein